MHFPIKVDSLYKPVAKSLLLFLQTQNPSEFLQPMWSHLKHRNSDNSKSGEASTQMWTALRLWLMADISCPICKNCEPWVLCQCTKCGNCQYRRALLAQAWCTSCYDLESPKKHKATEFLVTVGHKEEDSPHLPALREECRRELLRESKEIQICGVQCKQNNIFGCFQNKFWEKKKKKESSKWFAWKFRVKKKITQIKN